MVYSVTRLPTDGPRNSASVVNYQYCCRQGRLLGSSSRTSAPAVGGNRVKSATVFLAPLVALLLLLLPSPASAFAPTTLQQADAPPPTPTPEIRLEATPEPTTEPPAPPTAQQKAEPTEEPTPEPQASTPITDLHATAGRLRGRVEIGWSVASAPDQGGAVFVVERSTNGSSWRPVKACYVAYEREGKSYSCTDSRLASGATYAYRACLTGKATSCSNAVTTDSVSVKAP